MEKTDMVVKVLRQGQHRGNEEVKEPFAEVEVKDPATGESKRFTCRNIFDFGYVVNPAYSVAEGLKAGGLIDDDKWMYFDEKKGGWFDVRPLTAFEKKAIKYLEEFPPIETGILMQHS